MRGAGAPWQQAPHIRLVSRSSELVFERTIRNLSASVRREPVLAEAEGGICTSDKSVLHPRPILPIDDLLTSQFDSPAEAVYQASIATRKRRRSLRTRKWVAASTAPARTQNSGHVMCMCCAAPSLNPTALLPGFEHVGGPVCFEPVPISDVFASPTVRLDCLDDPCR
jgi:hypothetical protein